MKQYASKDITAHKTEPVSHKASEAASGQIGTSLAYRGATLIGGRGFEPPRDEGKTIHKTGSQRRY